MLFDGHKVTRVLSFYLLVPHYIIQPIDTQKKAWEVPLMSFPLTEALALPFLSKNDNAKPTQI